MKPTVIVHGGAFNIPKSFVAPYRAGTQEAALAGFKALEDGGSALDAVECAVRRLEDNPVFNAGHGSVLTEIGTVEMDAIVAVGDGCRTGAVTCVRDIANPVSLARAVMENTPHCILAGEGAVRFAKKMGVSQLAPKDLITQESVCKSFSMEKGTYSAHIETYMNSIVNAKDATELEAFYNSLMKPSGGISPADWGGLLSPPDPSDGGHDTVGAVAIDSLGSVACATSTGGMPGKMPGRVGDSPIFGCGAYANPHAACSSTGHGESLIRGTVCRDAVSLIETGYSVSDAASKSLEAMLKLTGGRGGIIMIDKHGNVAHEFNTSAMAWAMVNEDEKRCGLNPGEDFQF